MGLSIRCVRRNGSLWLSCWLISVLAAVASTASPQSVLTQHNDAQRTGANLAETHLTPQSVSESFGPLYTLDISGPPGKGPNTVGAQPLYVSSVLMNGVAHEVLYAATRQNWIFAYDVTGTSQPHLLWKIELRDSRGFGAEELPGMEARFSGDTRILCQQTRGPVGIASAPVIDPATNTMWVIYRTSSPLHRSSPKLFADPPVYDAQFYLRKIDIRSGASLGERQIELPSSDPHWADRILSRTGLLLMNGVIYIGFAGAVCDDGGGPWDQPDNVPAHAPHAAHGWIVALDANRLGVIAALPTTTDAWMGGIWQSGSGLAADRNGNVYALSGNYEHGNPLPTSAPELADAFLEVRLSGTMLTPKHFTMPDWARLDAGDADPASGGPVVLPNGFILGGGKPGTFYLMDPANMSVKQRFQAFSHTWHDGIDPCDLDFDQAYGPNIHGAPVVWHPDGVPYSLVYGMPEKDYLKAFRAFDDGRIEERPFLATLDSGVRSPRGMPGGALSLSAAGGQNGILWVSSIEQDEGDGLNTSGEFLGRLMAFDAATLEKLWEAPEQNVPFAKYIPPTIGGGKVFRSAYADKIYVYGLASTLGGAHRGILRTLQLSSSPTRAVTALWRDQNHLDIFATGRKLGGGSVLSTNWQGGVCPSGVVRAWKGWFPINSDMDAVGDGSPLPAGTLFTASGAAPVEAQIAPSLPGVPSPHLDLFVAATDGQVMSTVWENRPKRPTIQKTINGKNITVSVSTGLFPPTDWQKWFPVGPGSITVAPRQPITAIWRPGSAHLDLFAVGKDGRVMSTFFEGNRWQPAWFAIAPTTLATPGQRVAALWHGSSHLDLFITGTDGKVMSTYFENNRWQPGWFAINAATGVTTPGESVSALWRPNSTHLDLFMTDRQGRVISTYFETNQWTSAWFPVDPASGAAALGQTVTALWRNANHLDLFITDKDGRVLSTYFESDHWQPAWFAISPNSATAAPSQEVTAIWASGSNHLDLFITAKDGRVMSIFFDNNQWAPAWFAI